MSRMYYNRGFVFLTATNNKYEQNWKSHQPPFPQPSRESSRASTDHYHCKSGGKTLGTSPHHKSIMPPRIITHHLIKHIFHIHDINGFMCETVDNKFNHIISNDLFHTGAGGRRPNDRKKESGDMSAAILLLYWWGWYCAGG